MASDGIRLVHDQPEKGWTTELSEIFGYNKANGWVLDPFRQAPMGLLIPPSATIPTRRVILGRC
jgi:hypothetical protein